MTTKTDTVTILTLKHEFNSIPATAQHWQIPNNLLSYFPSLPPHVALCDKDTALKETLEVYSQILDFNKTSIK